MQIHRTEITTGILILGTVAGFLGVLVILGMPGLLTSLNTYQIYYDNAAGIRPGAPVLQAGREIGKVTSVAAVPLEERPVGHPECEVSVEVQVKRSAVIYRDMTVRLAQQGMMGLQEIDFVHGDIGAGLAENHADFIGTRVPDVSEAVEGMVADVKRLTGPDSDLGHTIKNLRALTEPDSSLALTLANLKDLTGPNADLALTLQKAKTFMQTLNDSKMSDAIKNADQFTDTIKRQPWRLIWPSTKIYPDDPPEETHAGKKAMPAAPAIKTGNSLATIKHA
jgi:ABC-type transporter Mla subunit MlaD